MTTVTEEQLATTEGKCLVAALQGLFNSLIGEKPQFRSGEPMDDNITCDGIIGSIALVGDIDWSLVISLCEQTAEQVVERFTGFPVPFQSSDMADAVGELANLLAGELKVELDRAGIKADISLPQVFRGQGIQVMSLSKQEPNVYVFESSCGPLLVAVVSQNA